jgi:hypothetical protein
MIVLNRSTASKDKELAALKLQTEQQINTLIGEVRGMYITTLPGQDLIYSAKELEGIDYLKPGSNPSLVDFPFIRAEIGTTGQTGQEVAQVYLNLSAMWRALAAQLEQVRLGYIYQVAAAPDAAGVATALGDCDATLGVFRRV